MVAKVISELKSVSRLKIFLETDHRTLRYANPFLPWGVRNCIYVYY